MKLLLYCTKAKPYLKRYWFNGDNGSGFTYETSYCQNEEKECEQNLNGNIVAECDFEVEEHNETTNDWLCMSLREKIVFGNLCEEANIDELKCYEYANGKPFYAIHIKNLHIFDEPKKTSEYNTYNRKGKVHIANIPIYTAPQNMMYAFDYYGNPFVLISIKPEWLCKILNGEKTIEVRKKVLKKMIS